MTKEYSKRFYNRTEYYKDEGCTMRHRDNDLPAIVWNDGTQYWYQNGKCHRETGPAIIYSNGEKFYYLNGVEYSETEFYIKIEKPYLLTFI